MKLKTRRWNRLRTYAAICWCGMQFFVLTTIFQRFMHLPAWFDLVGPMAVILLSLGCCVLTVKSYRPLPRGYCQVCDYNLKGNTSGLCPECGEPHKLASNEL